MINGGAQLRCGVLFNSHGRRIWGRIILFRRGNPATSEEAIKGGTKAEQDVLVERVDQVGAPRSTQTETFGGCEQTGGGGETEEEGSTDSGWLFQEGVGSAIGLDRDAAVWHNAVWLGMTFVATTNIINGQSSASRHFIRTRCPTRS